MTLRSPRSALSRIAALLSACLAPAGLCFGQTYLDNETLYSNQDPNTETRRSDHFRLCFGHFNRDTGTPMTEQLAQGNLRMYEQMWNRWVVEMGLHDINESVTKPDGKKYRANFNFLMTWNDGGGGGAYSSMDGNGFFYAMANSGYCRFDPPSGATPHEFGHVWEGSCAGFNGSDSSGAWWECTANWMQLQFLNTYPQADAYLYNGVYYPAHGRAFYHSFVIWETALEDPRYGAAWVNNVWTNANPEQRKSEYILDRMIRCDASGSPDKAGAVKELWGDMTKKMLTWDFERQRWLATANRPDDGSHWEFYQRTRTPLVKVPGHPGRYRPARAHLPMQFGFNLIPLSVTNGTTVFCVFEPQCDPVRQSDWRACLVAVNNAGEANYSSLWSAGTNSLTLSADQGKCYLAVIATPKPMKIADPAWQAYLTDAGLQFPYMVSFLNASPRNIVYPRPVSGVSWKTFTNADGTKCTNVASGATIDATAYVSPTAIVLGSAQIRGKTRIEDFAVVKDSVKITNAIISGHALLEGNALVYGNAKVRDWARVFGYAEVFENGRVIEHANCGDGNATTHTKVYGNAVIKGTTSVYDTSTFNGCLIMDGDSANGNGTTPSSTGVHFGWAWGQAPARFRVLPDNQWVYAQHTFEKDNAVFAMDQFGINHGFLMNRCLSEPDSGSDKRGGRVLPLNGSGQYVELHNTINDFKECAIAVWLKWSGGPAGQRVWSMGDGAQKSMCLVANDAETGGLRFSITDGTATWTLDGGLLSPETWVHTAVVFSGTTCTLYVNGAPIASKPAATLFPHDLNAPLMENANFLGRGNDGDYFRGSVDDFRVYMKALSDEEVAAIYSAPPPAPVFVPEDTSPPTPEIPAWLVSPRQCAADAVTMSATPGTDDSGWVEYYFACVSGPGHDSGWVSFNKYTDTGLPSGTPIAYTVKMRDRSGNTTGECDPGNVTLATGPLPTPSFAYGPVGIANGQITMNALRPSGLPAKIEYKFDCVTTPGTSSGWQSSPKWTHTGLAAGASYSYTITARDGAGNVSAASAANAAVARDDAPPRLPMRFAQWEMLPYATIDNRISMTAMAPADAGSVEYQFRCLSGEAPDSAWQSSRSFATPALPDGTYVYQYRVRDTSPQRNTSEPSSSYPATINPTTGYHSCSLEQLASLPDDALVSFSGTVMKVNTNNYYVKDTASGAAIKVRPATSNQTTSAALALKQVLVKGHLYAFSGTKEVTFATLTAVGDPLLYAVSGRVTNMAGLGIAGATVHFADVSGAVANAIVTATTDASGAYSKPLTPGRWYLVATASAYNSSPERELTVVSAPIANVAFGLPSNARVSGKVLRRADSAPAASAAVYFSRSPGASAAPMFTATADRQGNFTQPLQDGTWYVAAGGAGYYTTADKTLFIAGVEIPAIDFVVQSSARNIPAVSSLLFAALTESLPASGATGPWPTLVPQGKTLSTLGSPSVEIIDGVRWERNLYADGDGYNQARYASALPCNGVTVVAAVRPVYTAVGGEPRGEIIDVFYDRLALAVSHADGRVMVARNYWNDWGPAIANGRKVILSLVVQVNGSYKVYANSAQIMSGGANGNWTSINPDHSSTWGSDPDFTHYISVGRNAPDGWSTFNGHIGDVFVYTNALPDADRLALEADLTAKFLSVDYTVSVSAGAGGYVNPTGTVPVNPGGSQTFTITPLAGYVVTNVVVDGVSRGATNSWTLVNVAANHTLAAAFAVAQVTRPTLAVAPDGTGRVDITWPETYTGQLLASPVIGPGAVWTPMGIPPTVANGLKKVTVTPLETTFYGLGR